MNSALRAAGFIIFRRQPPSDVQFLLLQTSYGQNHWTPPKGHLDPGETEMEAALRETREEAGLPTESLKITPEKFEICYVVKGVFKIVSYWLAEFDPDQLYDVKLSHEHIDYKWANLEEAVQLVVHEDMANLLKRSQTYIEENMQSGVIHKR